MPLLGKTVRADAQVLQRGLLFFFVHWFNEGCSLEGGEIGEMVRSVGKVTRETIGIPSFSISGFFFCFPKVKSTNFPNICKNFAEFSISQIYKNIYFQNFI